MSEGKSNLVEDYYVFVDGVNQELHVKNNYLKNGKYNYDLLEKDVTITYKYDEDFRGYIEFKLIRELYEIRYFNMYYNELSEKYKKLLVAYLETFDYRSDNNLRGYRGGNKQLNLRILEVFYGLDKLEFDIISYFNGKEYFKQGDIALLHEICACEFRTNPEFVDYFKRMVYDNENVKSMREYLISGAIISNNGEVITACMDLLKAARLSEGLRSTVLNCIDLGSLETYKMFLEYMRAEKLLRFSSVKLAFRNYTGLAIDNSDNFEKVGNYVFDCVLDGKTFEYLEDENPLKVYVGLYALAIENYEKAFDYIKGNCTTAKSYRASCFIYFMFMSSMPVNGKIITMCLRNAIDDSNKAAIFTYLPTLYFDDDIDKKEYVLEALAVLKELKLTTKFMLFTDETQNKLKVYDQYKHILQYVKELDACYEEAYELFTKFDGSTNGRARDKFEYFDKIYHPAQRMALLNGITCSDFWTSRFSRETIQKLDIKFNEEEYFELAKKLKTTSSTLRVTICELFKVADPVVILKVSKFLLESKKAEMKSGGLSILVDNLDRVKDFSEFEELKVVIKDLDFAHEIANLKDTLLGVEVKEEIKEEIVAEVVDFEAPTLTWEQSLVDKILNFDFTIVEKLADKWYEMFVKHYGEEYEVTAHDGSKHTLIIGTNVKHMMRSSYHVEGGDYKRYFYHEEFLNELDHMSDEEIALLYYINNTFYDYKKNFADLKSYNPNYKREYGKYKYYMENGILPDFDGLYKTLYGRTSNQVKINKVANFSAVMDMLVDYYEVVRGKNVRLNEDYQKIMFNHLAFTIEFVKKNVESLPECFYDDQGIGVPHFVSDKVMNNMVYYDDNYAFDILQNMLKLLDTKYSYVNVKVYFYFLGKGLLKRDFFVNKLLDIYFKAYDVSSTYGKYSPYDLVIHDVSKELSYVARDKEYHKLPQRDLILDIYNEVVDKMLAIELQRTDSTTEYTAIVNKLSIFFGVDVFCKVLDKMKKIDFVRGYLYGFESGMKEVFSKIIGQTRPEDDLTQETFAKTVKKYKISDKKLLEASLYNQYFTRFGAEYLNIDGLEKAMYYFKAHSLDHTWGVLDETKVMINRFSEFELEDFVDGKMDIRWFNDIQEELSEKDYKAVYDAAKYVMNTAKRKRGQYFADAVMGKLDIAEVEAKINDTRNQDMLLCLGLLPLGTGEAKEKETLRRYKRMQLFLKETKQFGSQRRATETRRGNIAIANLATNYGVDINRFTWIMESKLIEDVNDVFTPKVVGDIEVYLSLEKVDKPEIVMLKEGKALKTLPAKYKKDEHILRLNQVKKDIKSQYSRAKVTLENAMCNSDDFELSELSLMNSHPIVKELIKDVLFIANGFIGFLKGDVLVDLNGEEKLLTLDTKVRIVHCVDLFENDWAKWQTYVMENKIVQPFKQVFRELYTLTDEELANDGYSNRFAGYQIEGKKAFGVLSSRNWLVNDYDGFEKVNHAHDLRVDLYCYANWRNTNLLEEETLEKVTFINNKTNKTMDMKNLDKVLFSETMRDLDLVVSVAYVGGVDPLLNHTTLEMRKRILEHNLGLFKIKNFEFKEKHIIIKGSLGEYTIHLGSGVVSVMGKGMLPMTPVHSQKRGQIFLPFVDEDPKTSEILTKVLMLAEDNKLKDPTILQFLK